MRARKTVGITAGLVSAFVAYAQLSGVAINSVTSKPLADTLIILHLDAPGDLAATAVTDSGGHFLFDKLPEGMYTLEARHTGYDTSWFGVCPGEEQGLPLQIKPLVKRSGLLIALPPLAVITGTITGADGGPLSRALVVARPSFSRPGQRVSKRQRFLSAESDARGHFRLFGLPAGTYFVSAASSETTFVEEAAEMGRQGAAGAKYQAAYYPGTPSRASAIPIKLAPGETRENVDFQLALVRAATINVRVQPPAGMDGPLTFAAGLSSAFEDSLMGFGFSTGGSTKNPIFFSEVYPGTYYLHLYARKDGLVFGAYSRIDVAAADSSHEIAVQLSPAFAIQGHLHFDSLPFDPKSFRVVLKPTPVVVVEGIDPSSAVIGPDGSFVIPNVIPGPWDVEMESIPAGSYVKSIRFGDKDVFHEQMIVDGPTTETLEIFVSSKPAEVSGVTTDAKTAKILLAPARDVAKTYLYRVTTTEADGSFRMRDVPPGPYNLFAFRTLEDDAWLDPDFRARIAGSGKPIELKENTKLKVELTAFNPKSTNCAGQAQ